MTRPRLPSGWERGLKSALLVGGVLTLVGLVASPERVWPNLLLASFLVLGTGLAGLLFVAFGYLTRAGWLVAIRRVPEAMAATLPVGAAGLVIALLGYSHLYEWSHADVVAADAILQSKAGWLNPGFFLVRAALFLGAWLLFAKLILKVSRGQDTSRDLAATQRNSALSAIFLVVFAITFSLASFDWLMSIEPHWYSTVFAVYHFSGLFLAGLATITVTAIALKRLGPLRGVLSPDHLHDLGQLTLGFATFWAYLWYCQHMLIWYGDMPEETSYYALRLQGSWGPLSILNVGVTWLIPFLVLLPRPSKRSESVMLKVALLLLGARWLDLYLQLLPPFLPDGPAIGTWEIAPLATAVAAFALTFFRALGRAAIVPRGDPLLLESLHPRAHG